MHVLLRQKVTNKFMKDDTFFALLACSVIFGVSLAFVWLIIVLIKIIIIGFITVL